MQETIEDIILRIANEKAISFPDGYTVVFWDKDGKCRAISAEVENIHFSIPELDNQNFNYSLSLIVGYNEL